MKSQVCPVDRYISDLFPVDRYRPRVCPVNRYARQDSPRIHTGVCPVNRYAQLFTEIRGSIRLRSLPTSDFRWKTMSELSVSSPNRGVPSGRLKRSQAAKSAISDRRNRKPCLKRREQLIRASPKLQKTAENVAKTATCSDFSSRNAQSFATEPKPMAEKASHVTRKRLMGHG